MSEITDPIIGERYQLIQPLGEGGMGMVYYGEDIHTQQPVAVKMLKPEYLTSSSEGIERFKREAEALYQIDHPNIVRVLDTIYENGIYYIVMEYIDGGSLRQVLQREKRLPLMDGLNICLDLTDALIRTHRLKIIHRDVKPDNVLLTSAGVPRLTDFGAVYMADATQLTINGAFVGTLSYVAPEILMGEKADPLADIWSFGVMMYEWLSGFRPFMGATSREIIFAILQQPTPDLQKLRQDCPPDLVNLVHAMLHKDKAARISSMRQVGAHLEEILDNIT